VDYNDAPEFTHTWTAAVPEGDYAAGADAQVLGVLVATDAESDASTLTFSIVRDEMQAFELHADGSLLFAPRVGMRLDAEVPPSPAVSVRVRVTDVGGAFSETTVTLGILDVQEAPVLLSDAGKLTRLSLPETAASGTVLATISAVDPEGDQLSMLIESANAPGALELDGPRIVLADAGMIDYEGVTGVQSIQAVVRLSDTKGLFTEVPVAVAITDENDAPVIANANVELAESSNAVMVHTMQFSDADAVDAEQASFSGELCWQPAHLTDATDLQVGSSSTRVHLAASGSTQLELRTANGDVQLNMHVSSTAVAGVSTNGASVLELTWANGAVRVTTLAGFVLFSVVVDTS
jgi:hypothetical protein